MSIQRTVNIPALITVSYMPVLITPKQKPKYVKLPEEGRLQPSGFTAFIAESEFKQQEKFMKFLNISTDKPEKNEAKAAASDTDPENTLFRRTFRTDTALLRRTPAGIRQKPAETCRIPAENLKKSPETPPLPHS